MLAFASSLHSCALVVGWCRCLVCISAFERNIPAVCSLEDIEVLGLACKSARKHSTHAQRHTGTHTRAGQLTHRVVCASHFRLVYGGYSSCYSNTCVRFEMFGQSGDFLAFAAFCGLVQGFRVHAWTSGSSPYIFVSRLSKPGRHKILGSE